MFFSKRKKIYWKEVEKSYQIVQKSYHQINYFKRCKPLKLRARFYPDTRYSTLASRHIFLPFVSSSFRKLEN